MERGNVRDFKTQILLFCVYNIWLRTYICTYMSRVMETMEENITLI